MLCYQKTLRPEKSVIKIHADLCRWSGNVFPVFEFFSLAATMRIDYGDVAIQQFECSVMTEISEIMGVMHLQIWLLILEHVTSVISAPKYFWLPNVHF